MKRLLTTAALILSTAIPALAETPNRTTMTYAEFVGASGCVIRDNAAGQSNLYAISGGNCAFAVTQAWIGGSHKTIATTGDDGVFGTADDGTAQVSDN